MASRLIRQSLLALTDAALPERYSLRKSRDDRVKELLTADLLNTVPDWELESTTAQLAALADVRPDRHDELLHLAAHLARRGSTSDSTLRPSFGTKLGLGLSGGGFRATLFHLGVLAALADAGVLRHVEVMSCVSGGSIAGVAYYCALAEEIEAVGDPTDEQVQQVVERCIAGSLDVICRTNVRMRAFVSPFAIAAGWRRRRHNRAQRLGWILERKLFGELLGRRPRNMTDLRVTPFGTTEHFNPKRHNWSRATKVPVLLINATTLNTSHAWQFTASWVGEPPSGAEGTSDATERLTRQWYDEQDQAPGGSACASADAVAVSAGVLMLFSADGASCNLYPG
ncbi:MAG: patatin-like phospholipase family protein [Ilumatobacteraceae bacterium]